MRTTVSIIAFLLLAVGLFTPQYAQADALFLTSLPYENASGWDFTSSSWSNKIVIKPEAFGSNLDPDKYTYSLQVKTDCGVQVGHAVWTGDTEDWKGEIHPATDGLTQIFTLTGVPVTDMTPGDVYIVVRNGKARKIIR